MSQIPVLKHVAKPVSRLFCGLIGHKRYWCERLQRDACYKCGAKRP